MEVSRRGGLKKNNEGRKLTEPGGNKQYYDPFDAHIRNVENKIKNEDPAKIGLDSRGKGNGQDDMGDSYYSQVVRADRDPKQAISVQFGTRQQTNMRFADDEEEYDAEGKSFVSAPNKIRRPRNGGGFNSVQRERNPIKLIDESNQNNNQTNLPEIRNNISVMERNMEKELDREAKLKKDAKKLIVHAMGKNDGFGADRTVKAWLKQTKDEPEYINQGQAYTKDYRQLIQKEIDRNKQNYPVMEQFMKKGLFDNMSPALQNGLQAAKQKYKNEYLAKLNNTENSQMIFDYNQIKEVYNVSLVDSFLNSNPGDYLMKKKEDAKQTISHVFKRKFEEKIIFQQLNDPKTLRREKIKLEEKLKMIAIAVELAKQRLEWLIYDTPFTIEELEEEVRDQKSTGQNKSIINEEGGEDAERKKQQQQRFENYKLDKKMIAEMQRQSRLARNLLKLQMLEARALKNRTGCDSIADLVLLFREFQHIERQEDMKILLNDALMNKKKSLDFFEYIKRITDFEDEMLRVRLEFVNEKIEEKGYDGDKFYNYDEIVLQKLKDKDKEEFLKIFRQSKIIFLFIPFWYIPMTVENNSHSAQLRQMLHLDIMQARAICDYINCQTMDDFIVYHRNNRVRKEFVIFDQSDVAYLNRERRVPQDLIKNIGETIFLLAKEALMVPELMFKLAKPTKMVEVNFSNVTNQQLTVDAIASIMACIEIHQSYIKRIKFNQCNINKDGAMMFKIILSDANKNIIHCDLDNNNLGDMGIDHIVSSMKNNSRGDMRILKVAENKLSIQAAIRISHVLKKRPSNLPILNLQVLVMHHNEIGNIGSETLMNFIKSNDTLKYLDLSFNKIEDRGLLSIADCLRLNSKLQVLNILGNEFTSKSLPVFSSSLVENKRLNLLILKIGNLNCDLQTFLNFINNGFMTSTHLRYLYFTSSAYYNNEVIKSSNESFLPKVIYSTPQNDPNINSNILLDFIVQIVENQLIDGQNSTKVYKYGEKLLREIIKEKYKLSNIEILVYLFENIFGPEFILQEQISSFHMFAKYGQLEAVSYSLKLGVSPNFKTSITYEDYPSATALHIAAGYNQIELCEHLIKFGVEIDNKDLNGNTALHYAGIQGSYPLAKLLVENKASLLTTNKENMLPLHSAVFSDNISCFKYILEESQKQKQIQYLGKQIEEAKDIKTYKGLTPLMLAIEENSQKIFEYLLESNADLRAQDEEGHTALQRAILIKDQKKAKQLVKYGANYEIRSFNGETAIMLAVRNGLMEVLRVLVNKGADITEKNYRGDTLLHLAAKIERADIIGYLLDKGLSTQEKNRDGQKPKDVAAKQAIKDMLQRDNNTFNIYKDGNNPNNAKKPLRIKAQQPSEKGQDSAADTWYDYKDRAMENKDKLINEQLVKYNVNKDIDDNISSAYVSKFQQYQAPDNNAIINQNNNNIKGQQQMQKNIATKSFKEDEFDDEQEEEELEDEDFEASKTQMTKRKTLNNSGRGGGNILKIQGNNKNNLNAMQKQQIANNTINNNNNNFKQQDPRAFESAGFKGTLNQTNQNKSHILNQIPNNKNNLQQQQNLTNNANKKNNLTIGRESKFDEDEFDDEEGEEEEYEENEAQNSYLGKTKGGGNTKKFTGNTFRTINK